MALNAVYFAVLYFYSVIHGLAAEQDADCRLIPTQKADISSEFRLKASEKGVRMVYLNLKIGNDSYHPLELGEEFLSDRWVWASSIKEHMLSLPENYVVLSLGLLTHQVRSINVPLEDKPKGCLAGLDSSDQNMAIGKMLLENVIVETENSGDFQLHKAQVVCVAMINHHIVEYRCCSMSRDMVNRPNQVLCDQTVGSSNWLELFNVILILIAVFSTFYIPAFPLALPDCIFSLQHECDKQDRHTEEINSDSQADHLHPMTGNGYVEIIQDDEEDGEIPLDDASPITISTFLFGYVRRMPDLWLSFNLKLAFMLFCVYPFFVYVELGLTFLLNENRINEASRKETGGGLSPSSLITFNGIRTIVVAFFNCTAFILVLLLRPKDLLFPEERISRCSICRMTLLVCKATFVLPGVARRFSVVDDILLHLRILQHTLYFLLSFFTKQYLRCLNRIFNLCMCFVNMNNNYWKVSRLWSALCVIWVLFAFLPTLIVALVFGVVCMFLYLVTSILSIVICSPFMTLGIAFATKSRHRFAQVLYRQVDVLPLKAKFFGFALTLCIHSYFALLYVGTAYTVYFSCCFITGTVAYTIMGFALNADIVTPYAAFFLVVVTNIWK